MGTNAAIEWTDATWNPMTGCTKISPGCKHCYAERMAKRLKAMGQPNYVNGFRLTLHTSMLGMPLKLRKPSVIFVNSMSDLFHKDVPDQLIRQVFDVMNEADWHTYQVLTKRSERVAQMSTTLPWWHHIWMGVSVENEEYLHRIDDLRKTNAYVCFLSLEPVLGPLPNLNLDGIGWVIVGGESGPEARPINADWVRQIRDRCVASGVPIFFKQWGGINRKRAGRVLDGRTWDEIPAMGS